MPPATPTESTYEAYRLHQKELFTRAVEDATLIARRTAGINHDSDTVFRLALALFEKRCEPLNAYQPTVTASKRPRATKAASAPTGNGTEATA
ncbi:MAG TPA: hypothetical protein VNZ52_07800 [Candidatus Thermoplasmatota archaeon]|nr:hypothetical protein [Candidatus Thermoplasmatota archaeon]